MNMEKLMLLMFAKATDEFMLLHNKAETEGKDR